MIDDVTDPAQLGADDARSEAHELAQAGKGFNPAQKRQITEWAVADGTLSREEADQALRDSGLDPLAVDSQADPDSPATAIDEAFPAADPMDYVLPPLVDDDEAYTESHREFDMLRRQWLASARFPKGLGESVMRQAARTAEKYASMDDTAAELYARAELAKVQKLFNEDGDSMLAHAMKLAEEIEAKHGGFFYFLNETGAGSDSYIISLLALQAKRLADRQGASA